MIVTIGKTSSRGDRSLVLSRIARAAMVPGLLAAALTLAPQALADNICDPGESPDIITGDIVGTTRHGTIGDITAYSIGTTSCNVGTCMANWVSSTAEHPLIGQNLFRLKNGR